MSTRPHPAVPVTSDVELTERWRALLQLDGPPSRRTLFLAWLRRDGTMVPLLLPVEDVPFEPDRVALGNLVTVHATVTRQVLASSSTRPRGPTRGMRNPAAAGASSSTLQPR